MSGLIRKLSSGLVYQEDFDDVTPWTRLSGGGTVSIVGGRLRFTAPNLDYWYINTISNRKNSFIQSRANLTQAAGYMGHACRLITAVQNEVHSYGHWHRIAGDFDRLYQYVGGVSTLLVSYAHVGIQRTGLSYYNESLWLNEGNYGLFYDSNDGGHTHDGTDCTQLGIGKTGIFGHAPAGQVNIERFNIMTDKDIQCIGMQNGWKLRIDENDTYKATESGGTATVDCFDLIFPVSKIEILNEGDIIKGTFELSNGIWAGDRFDAEDISSYKYNLDTDALAFKDLCRIDVNGVPGSWF